MTTPPPSVRREIDVESYHRTGEAGILHPDERVELVAGDIVEMVPIGSAHGGTTARISPTLVRASEDTAALVTPASRRHIDRFDEPQPDVPVLRRCDDEYRKARPSPADALLVIAVAQSSLDDDRGFESRLSAGAGAAELWLVDLAGGAVELHRGSSPEGQGERTRHTSGELRPQLVADLALDVAAVFA